MKKSSYKIILQAVLINLVLMVFFLFIILILFWKNRANFIDFIVNEYRSRQSSVVTVPIPLLEKEETKKEEIIANLPIVKEKKVEKEEVPTVVSAVKIAKPAVVSIIALNKETNKRVGSGTGFLISPDGVIVTNRHVVSSVTSSYIVEMNGLEYKAEILDKDPVYDVALIKILGRNLPYLKLADSDTLQVGETVIAIGNALGEFENTVSVGVISGLARSVVAEEGINGEKEYLDKVIQTDAAINKGNSGGPLLNINGDVVGINVAIIKNSSNIGFSLPINSVKDTISSVIKTGKIVRPYVGVRYVMITPSIKENNNLAYEYGIWIKKSSSDEPAVLVGSPAEKAGLKEGDIILEIDGKIIDINTNFMKMIRDKKIGDYIVMKVYSDGVIKTVFVVLAQAPSDL